jgi:uncharacterized protein (TIGR03435 family)
MMANLSGLLLAANGSPAAALVAKATLITALALAGAWLARGSRASVRHVLLAAAFAALLTLPIASMVAPAIQLAVPVRASDLAVPNVVETVAGAGSAGTAADAGPAGATGTPRASWFSMSAILAVGWIAGATLFLLPVIAGLWQLRRLRRLGLPWRHGRALVDALALEAGIRRRVDVVLHESIPGPMTCGVLHPAIVLPVDAPAWPAEDLRRAIVHELEHVRRGDWLTHCVARTACACYWFHPLVWMAWRELSLEAERACDDAVLRRAEATAYADQLVLLAERLSAAANPPVLAMANRADLAARVGAVLDPRRRRGRAGPRWVALAGAAALVVVTTISPLRIVAAGQAGAAAPAASEKFEVVSVKPCENEPPTPPGQRSSQGGFPAMSPGRFTFECGTVERLISTAYVQNGEPLTNQAARIGDIQWLKGVPGWVRSEKFTIEAKAEGTPDRKVMMGPMLRALLEDRFQLKVHRATDEAAMYAMTLAKGGLRIQPIGEDGCTKYDPDNPPGRDEMRRLAEGAKPVCGNMNMMHAGGQMRWSIGGTTMQNFAGTLSAFMDRHVIDRTGIEGRFNIIVTFAPDEHIPGPDKRPRAGPPVEPVELPPPDGPTIFMALEQQLGLKLETTRAPHGFLVIDRVERPSPNSGPSILDSPVHGRGAGPGQRGRS